ncbi:hypothetical protein NEISICOT_02653 [Neisseria sicca ATCC 29256]|uniref:Uncharacterized protein n=2 Tax=Neisseria sicca TaxID=490 RepID=C6M7Y8_NEISI|nr:hypothetical protein NEISICOT_02653 [Neisseria sicca ATCC 29256]
MEMMCKALMDWETIDRDQVLEIMAGKQPSPPKDYSHNLRQDNPEQSETEAVTQAPEAVSQHEPASTETAQESSETAQAPSDKTQESSDKPEDQA